MPQLEAPFTPIRKDGRYFLSSRVQNLQLYDEVPELENDLVYSVNTSPLPTFDRYEFQSEEMDARIAGRYTVDTKVDTLCMPNDDNGNLEYEELPQDETVPYFPKTDWFSELGFMLCGGNCNEKK